MSEFDREKVRDPFGELHDLQTQLLEKLIRAQTPEECRAALIENEELCAKADALYKQLELENTKYYEIISRCAKSFDYYCANAPDPYYLQKEFEYAQRALSIDQTNDEMIYLCFKTAVLLSKPEAALAAARLYVHVDTNGRYYIRTFLNLLPYVIATKYPFVLTPEFENVLSVLNSCYPNAHFVPAIPFMFYHRFVRSDPGECAEWIRTARLDVKEKGDEVDRCCTDMEKEMCAPALLDDPDKAMALYKKLLSMSFIPAGERLLFENPLRHTEEKK